MTHALRSTLYVKMYFFYNLWKLCNIYLYDYMLSIFILANRESYSKELLYQYYLIFSPFFQSFIHTFSPFSSIFLFLSYLPLSLSSFFFHFTLILSIHLSPFFLIFQCYKWFSIVSSVNFPYLGQYSLVSLFYFEDFPIPCRPLVLTLISYSLYFEDWF